MPLWLQVTLSFVLVTMVLFFMWRLPRRGESFFGWAPPLALISVWAGLMAVVCAVITWFVSRPDPLIAASLLFVDPAAITTGTLVLWIYRRYESPEQTIGQQRIQAVVGIVLGILAVVVGYVFVFVYRTSDVS